MNILWPSSANKRISYISDPPAPEFAAKHIRNLAILGSTGSIGRSALKVCETAYSIKIRALAGGRNIKILAEQAQRWRPDYLAVLNADLAQELEALLPPVYRPIIFWGQNGYANIASLPEVDSVLSAQSGASGLTGTIAAALAGKVIALANKESLVLAGSLLRRLCRQYKAAILPVDSEHFALFQCAAGRGAAVKSLLLTASGGPFLGKNAEEIANATPAKALKHPNWSMGAKISIDSATMMNKGLELIEAIHLFGIDTNKIRIVVHPQSIVHSLVEFEDNSLLGQLATPDMRLAIGACLCWPDCQQNFIHPIDLTTVSRLEFMEPDFVAFPALGLAKRAADYKLTPAWIKLGLNPACIILNGANEAAVELFLAGQISFSEITSRVERALNILLENPPLPQFPENIEYLPLAARAVELARLIAPLDSQAREIAALG